MTNADLCDNNMRRLMPFGRFTPYLQFIFGCEGGESRANPETPKQNIRFVFWNDVMWKILHDTFYYEILQILVETVCG